MPFGPATLSGSRNPEPKELDETLDTNNTERPGVGEALSLQLPDQPDRE
jgi:hypothetical protein